MKTGSYFMTFVAVIICMNGCGNGGMIPDQAGPLDPGDLSNVDEQVTPDVAEGSDDTQMVEQQDQDNATLEREVVTAGAIATSAAIAHCVAAILPVKDLQAIYEGYAGLPSCPSMGTEFESNNILLTLAYGDGCSPSPYPASSLSGTVDGIAYVGISSFDFDFDELAVGGEPLEGTVAGGFTVVEDSTTFLINVSLVVADEVRLIGRATVEVPVSGGAMTISDAAFTVSNMADGPFELTLSDTVTEPNGNGGFAAYAGTASGVWSAEDSESNIVVTVDLSE